MLWKASAIEGYTIAGTDGEIGTVSDFLFQDAGWRIRWLVVDTGNWLPGRRVLIHPSALGQPDRDHRRFPVALTKTQIEESPGIDTDAPVSEQMEARLYGYFGWDPAWNDAAFPSGAIATPLVAPLFQLNELPNRAADGVMPAGNGDPHLHSTDDVIGYHIRASDGDIGHVADLLIDDQNWGVRYIIVDTRNWWPGKHVILSPVSVRALDWAAQHLEVDVSRQQVKDSPAYEPSMIVDRTYEQRVHKHYGWAGYWQ